MAISILRYLVKMIVIFDHCTVVSYQDFVSFGLTDALDVEQLLLGCIGHSLDGVETCLAQLLDVTATDPTLLHVKTQKQETAQWKFTERENPLGTARRQCVHTSSLLRGWGP